jgi:hypothetical protein
MNNAHKTQSVTSSLVGDDDRLTFLPSYFGLGLMMRGEALVYSWLRQLCKGYSGAYWHYYKLANGGFYMAPELSERLHLYVEGNGFSGEMSAEAAGIVANLFALSQLAAETEGTDKGDALIDHYHFLREFVYGHAESEAIIRAID